MHKYELIFGEKTAVDVTIDKDQAEWLIEHRLHANRPLKETAISCFADDMANGLWIRNGATIKVDKKGWVIDGQNRLHACVRAGVPFETLVAVVGDYREVMSSIDRGTTRSLADVLQLEGYTETKAIVAAARRLADICHDQIEDRKLYQRRHEGKLQNLNRLREFIDANAADLGPAIDCASTHAQYLQAFTSRSFFAATTAAFAIEAGAELAYEFAEKLATGMGVECNSPIWVLRLRLQKAKSNPREQLKQRAQISLIIRAWGHWVLGAPIKKLQASPQGDPYPMVLRPSDPIWKLRRKWK